MNTIRQILQDADPLHGEAGAHRAERQRLRRVIVAAAADPITLRGEPARLRRPPALLATMALVVIGMVVAGYQVWTPGDPALQAAVRFEVRLAEDEPGPGLREARIAGSGRVIYLHPEVIVSNGDIAESGVIAGADPSRFAVGLELNQAAAERMRRVTSGHVGRPVAILVDGQVVTAPIVRGPISRSAVISGDYTEAEAGRIAKGIVIH